MIRIRERQQIPQLYDASPRVLRKLVDDINRALVYVCDALPLEQDHLTAATAAHTITNPTDAPANADALRDNLVAVTLPQIVAALNALGARINALITSLEESGVLRKS